MSLISKNLSRLAWNSKVFRLPKLSIELSWHLAHRPGSATGTSFARNLHPSNFRPYVEDFSSTAYWWSWFFYHSRPWYQSIFKQNQRCFVSRNLFVCWWEARSSRWARKHVVWVHLQIKCSSFMKAPKVRRILADSNEVHLTDLGSTAAPEKERQAPYSSVGQVSAMIIITV